MGRDLEDGDEDNALEDKEQVDYCSPTKGKQDPHFNLWRDILVVDFVLLKLKGEEDYGGWEKR